MAGLVRSESTDKHLLLAAIEAVTAIRPRQAPEILADLTDAEDEEIVEAVMEALAMAEGLSEMEEEEEEEDH